MAEWTQAEWTEVAAAVALPDAPALVSSPDGIVVRATHQAAVLAGQRWADDLLGRSLPDLLVRDRSVHRLRGRERVVVVRAASWPATEDQRLRVTVLVDLSDLVGDAAPVSAAHRARLGEAQRRARIGTWEWEPVSDDMRLVEQQQEFADRANTRRLTFADYLAAVPPEERERVERAWRPLIDQHQPIEVTHRYRDADGVERLFQVQGTATTDARGEVLFVGTLQDVTGAGEGAPGGARDELTGLPNRSTAVELLEELLAHSPRDNIAVLACDLDNYKRVVTSLGHDTADEMRVVLANRLVGGLPPECTAARPSGEDEYLVLCSDVSAVGGVHSLATRISGLLSTPVPVGGHFVEVSASVGAAVPDEGAAASDVLRHADAAMHQAQERGSSQVAVATAELRSSVDEQVGMEGRLRHALRHDQLVVHYQPVVRADGTIVSAEALVRWPTEDRGVVSPGAFLPVARRGGLLRHLDSWVLRTALREAARWELPPGQQVGVAVNLAGLLPGDPEFDPVVARAIAESGCSWDRLTLELVETALGEDLPGSTLLSMHAMVDRGARFAVDDFGTGYSSLARLKNLPTEVLKVDRQFVAGLGRDDTDLAVARAIVELCQVLGRYCVAEGVETAEQFHLLADLGVDAFQGWLFGRPAPPAEFADLVARGVVDVPARPSSPATGS